MKNFFLPLIIISILLITGCSRKIIPEQPPLEAVAQDSIPLSEIDIPVHIALKPLFAMAEKQVEKVYTSPGWPTQFIQDGCDTKYQYHFRRGPLKIKAYGNSVELGFTGFYKVRGSQRACIGTTPVTAWTPPCSCGFNEPERKVEVGFKANFSILPDYTLQNYIERMEPRPIDKCEMCFVKYDVTKTVMDALKLQLDSSRIFLQDTLSKIKLRPYFQQVWDQLQRDWPLYGLGHLRIQPERIRVSSLVARNDSLHLSFGVSARPEISFEEKPVRQTGLPNLSDFTPKSGFRIHLDAQLNYDSLSKLVTERVKGQRIDLDNGPVKKYMIMDAVKVYGSNKNLVLQLSFSGSDKGVLYLTGKPTYSRDKKLLEVKDLNYDLRTKDFVLKSAKWLFSNKILTELKKYASFDASPYLAQLTEIAGKGMNRKINENISLKGGLKDFYIGGIYPLNEYLRIRTSCEGDADIMVKF